MPKPNVCIFFIFVCRPRSNDAAKVVIFLLPKKCTKNFVRVTKARQHRVSSFVFFAKILKIKRLCHYSTLFRPFNLPKTTLFRPFIWRNDTLFRGISKKNTNKPTLTECFPSSLGRHKASSKCAALSNLDCLL